MSGALERSLPFRLIVWRLAPRMWWLAGRLAPFPAGVLETRDARNGRRHRRALVAVPDGEAVVLVASKAGMAEDPFWYANALADPEVRFDGRPYRALPVDDPGERARLWDLAVRTWPANAGYQQRVTRTIPLLRLTAAPVADTAAHGG